MTRFFAQLEYQGTRYLGFQKQKNTKKTIQSQIESALSKVANHKITTICSGRTDSGVHATNQIIHFDSKSKRSTDSWIRGANTYLPNDIAVKNIFKVENNLHARFDAKYRTYIYLIKNSLQKPAIEANNSLWIRANLNIKKMNAACKHLLGEQDFSSFRSTNCQSKTAIRNIYSAIFIQKKEYILFQIKGNAFLQNMIRILVGTLIEVGKNNLTITKFKNIIKAKNRKKACKTVSPNGLYFIGPEYNDFTYTKNKVFLDELD
tara:strand:+ start:540 stop:1325 length:786 start_codon:yes stop_codon:yes gene_type:complete